MTTQSNSDAQSVTAAHLFGPQPQALLAKNACAFGYGLNDAAYDLQLVLNRIAFETRPTARRFRSSNGLQFNGRTKCASCLSLVNLLPCRAARRSLNLG